MQLLSSGLEEVQVQATELDEAMQFVRQSDQTQYASHVYQVEGDVDVLSLIQNIQVTVEIQHE